MLVGCVEGGFFKFLDYRACDDVGFCCCSDIYGPYVCLLLGCDIVYAWFLGLGDGVHGALEFLRVFGCPKVDVEGVEGVEVLALVG